MSTVLPSASRIRGVGLLCSPWGLAGGGAPPVPPTPAGKALPIPIADTLPSCAWMRACSSAMRELTSVLPTAARTAGVAWLIRGTAGMQYEKLKWKF